MGLRILNMIDSLIAAGAERMAVNIANGLADVGIDSYLCATHSSGDLARFFYDREKLLVANKKGFLDIVAFWRILRFVQKHRIQVIHSHSSSVYWACAIKMFRPGLKVVWHDHFGMSDYLEKRDKRGLLFCRKLIDYAFVVNSNLLRYAVEVLKFDPDRVYYLRNFPDLNFANVDLGTVNLPNEDKGPKILSLANIRPQKDHATLLTSFEKVLQQYPYAQLYMVGGDNQDEYLESVRNLSSKIDPARQHIHLLGSRTDVETILQKCQVGVLSSISEGLPVSLLEYGLAKLPVVSTAVGECADVLGNGEFGMLISPRDPDALADAIVKCLSGNGEVKDMANRFHLRVMESYSKQSAIGRIVMTYRLLLGEGMLWNHYD
ncbi:MAG: glycosyltransferase family 4 protein [Breznakibacter sp.]